MSSNSNLVVITGGAGFIGSHLCRYYHEVLGRRVISLDNYSSGSIQNHVPGVTYLSGSTSDINLHLNDVPDIIYHLGEFSRVENSYDHIEEVVESNIVGTLKVIEYCRKNSVKLIYAGSSTKFSVMQSQEDHNPYWWTKKKNTELVNYYSQWYGINYAIAYFYNVYGPREIEIGNYATLIGRFKKLAREKQPLTVVLPGSQRRNFTHVDDLVNGLVLVGEHGYGDDYGIGSSESYTILDIARLFGGEIKFLPERKGNRIDAELKTDKLMRKGWTSKISIIDYIEKLRVCNWDEDR